nr:hypothetical protein [Tanacetum cinerariifolium]
MNVSQDRQIQNVRGNGRNQFRQYAGQVAQNQQGYNAWQNGGIQVAQNVVQNAGGQSGGPRVLEMGIKPCATIAKDWVTLLGITQPDQGEGMMLIFRLSCSLLKKKKNGFNFKQKNLTAAAGDLDEIEEVNANCILMANLQHASTSGTQLDKAPVYDTNGLVEVQLNDNCYNNEIFNMFTQEEQYTDLLEPIPEPQLVSQNDNHVTSVSPSIMQSGGTVETSSAPNEETRAHQET